MKKNNPFVALAILFMIITVASSAQTNSDGSSPQFLFPEFTRGIIKLKNGNQQIAVLNYNTITERMVYMQDDKLFDLVNLKTIDTVFILKSKFVPEENSFYEVLMAGKASFYLQHKGELLSPGAPVGYGGTSQISNSKYLSSVELSSGYYNLKLPDDFNVSADPVCWIRMDTSEFSFRGEKQFLKIFPDQEQQLKKFLKSNRIKFDRVSDIVKVAGYLNEVLK